MRRFLSAGLAVLLASGLVLVGAPAYAVEPPPPPVTPFADLPSRTANYYNPSHLAPGSPAYDEWLAKMRAKVPAPVNAGLPGSPVKPLTAPSTLSRGAAGVLYSEAYAVGWGIGTLGLIGYSVLSGEDAWSGLASTCGTDSEWMNTVHKSLNFGLGPDCAFAIPEPNADQEPRFNLDYGTYHLVNSGKSYVYLGQYNYCFLRTGSTANSVVAVSAGGAAGVANVSGGTASSNATLCGANVAAVNAVANNLPAPMLRLELKSGTTVLATSTTTYPDPVRTPGCSILWANGSTTTGTGPTYKESEGMPVSSQATGCLAAWFAKHPSGIGANGVMPARITVTSNDGTATTTVSDQVIPEHTPEQRAALANTSTAGLVLTKTVAGVTDSCMTWAADCAGWWAATSSGTVPTTGTTTYTCTFGGVGVALVECGVYRQTFDVKTARPNITDPVTGDQEPWGAGAPTTGSGTTFDDQNSTSPGAGPTPGDACMSEWNSAPNPVEWVLHPVKCALVWAFVPRESEVERLTGELTSMWEATGVGLTINTITAWEFEPPSSGCGGVLVPMSTIFNHGVEDFSLLDACPGSPLEQTAVWSYWIILIASVINLLSSVTRNIGSIVGARGVAEGDD